MRKELGLWSHFLDAHSRPRRSTPVSCAVGPASSDWPATGLTDGIYHGTHDRKEVERLERRAKLAILKDRLVSSASVDTLSQEEHAPPRVPPWGNNAVERRDHSSPRSSNDMEYAAARCPADRSGAGGRIRLFYQLDGLCAWDMRTNMATDGMTRKMCHLL